MQTLFQILTAALKHLRLVQNASVKHLEAQHTRDCSAVYKSLEAKASQEIREPKENSDREEMNRLKKEKRSFIVKRCVEERRKLEDSLKVRLEREAKMFDEAKAKITKQVAARH